MINWQGIYLPNGEKHLQEWMRTVNRRDEFGRFTYQYHKLEAALKCVKKRRVAVDIGAHCGLWSMQLVNMFGMVHAFEPMAAHRECFGWNVRRAGSVLLHPYALGEKPGRVRVACRTPGSSGDTGVDPHAEASSLRASVSAEGEEVEMRTLDSFNLQDVDFIKIDVEGYELFVLKGAEETLKRCKPAIIVECKAEVGGEDRYGVSVRAPVDYLETLGAKVRNGIQGDYILSW